MPMLETHLRENPVPVEDARTIRKRVQRRIQRHADWYVADVTSYDGLTLVRMERVVESYPYPPLNPEYDVDGNPVMVYMLIHEWEYTLP